MKKLLILFTFLSFLSYSDSVGANYKANPDNVRINSFFQAIKTHNNIYARSFFQKSETTKERVGLYDVVMPKEVEKLEPLDVNVKDDKGYTPILIAAINDNLEIFDLLCKNGASLDVVHPVLGKTILNTAIYYDSNEVSKYIIENYEKYVNMPSVKDGWLPLEDAVLKENAKILTLLLENGAIIRKKDKNGYDVYDLATRHGKGEMVKILRSFEKSRKKF